MMRRLRSPAVRRPKSNKKKFAPTLQTLEERRAMAVVAASPVKNTASTWLQSNVKDSALKAQIASTAADKVFDRSDMINLLKKAGADGVVSAQELADLRSFVANSQSQFSVTDAVFNLANKVVNACVANGKFQGKDLGNLAAGDKADKLNKLVDKWFSGADRPAARAGDGSVFNYAYANGSLFVNGASYTDIHQGYLGDCYFLDALAATAKANPTAIANMFTDNGDGTFTVRFFNAGRADYVTVDRYLPVTRSGRFVFANMGQLASSNSNELWVGLAEKAYVEMNELGWLRANRGNSYDKIEGGYIAQAFAQVTGKASSLGLALNKDQLVAALNAGFMVGLASKSTPASPQIVGGHAYFITGYNAQTGKFTVFNPWGMNNGSQYPGLVELSWEDLTGSFAYWDKGSA